jgi:hypothetical protein
MARLEVLTMVTSMFTRNKPRHILAVHVSYFCSSKQVNCVCVWNLPKSCQIEPPSKEKIWGWVRVRHLGPNVRLLHARFGLSSDRTGLSRFLSWRTHAWSFSMRSSNVELSSMVLIV